MIPRWPQIFTRTCIGAALIVGGLLGALSLIALPGVVLTGAALGAVIGTAVGIRVRAIAGGDAGSRARSGRRGALITGAGFTGGWVVLTGLVLLGGSVAGAVLLLLAALTLTAWWWGRPDRGAPGFATPWAAVWTGLLRVAQHHPVPPHPVPSPRSSSRRLSSGFVLRVATPTPPPSEPPSWSATVPADLSTPQLCVAWQRTYFALLDLPVGAPRADLVGLRTALLDEIERRDPDGFTRWLDTGARAGSDPGRYLTG